MARAKTQMTAHDWLKWGERRIADAPDVAKLYKRQGEAAQKLVQEYGCPCNPIIVLPSGPDGPTFANPMVTHALECRR